MRSKQHNDTGFLSDIRCLNVALTRARKKLLLVGDSSTLGAHPFYKAFLDYVERVGGYRTAWKLQE